MCVCVFLSLSLSFYQFFFNLKALGIFIDIRQTGLYQLFEMKGIEVGLKDLKKKRLFFCKERKKERISIKKDKKREIMKETQ